jgi:DNA-binding NarL/FixJ family response regulator
MTDTKDHGIVELKRISRLLAEMIIRDVAQSDQIEILSKVGYQPREIADILGTTANTVRVTLANMRKKVKVPEARRKRNVKKK